MVTIQHLWKYLHVFEHRLALFLGLKLVLERLLTSNIKIYFLSNDFTSYWQNVNPLLLPEENLLTFFSLTHKNMNMWELRLLWWRVKEPPDHTFLACNQYQDGTKHTCNEKKKYSFWLYLSIFVQVNSRKKSSFKK